MNGELVDDSIPQIVELVDDPVPSGDLIEQLPEDSFADMYAQARHSNDKTRQFSIVQQLYEDSQEIALLPYLI